MAQKITVQDGIVTYSAADPTLSVNVGVEGELNVSQQLNVGDNDLGEGFITTTPDTNLTIQPGGNGTLALQPAGPLLMRNAIWPNGIIAPNAGYFLGATGLNTLEYLQFIIATNSSDSLTQSDLNTAYPNAIPGQMVSGPTVIYTCVAANTWRISGSSGGGSSPVVAESQIAFGDSSSSIISTSDFTYAAGVLTVNGTANGGTLTTASGQTIMLQADNIAFATSELSGNIIGFDNDMALTINGNSGTAGQVLTSNGPSAQISWTTPTNGTSIAPLVMELVSQGSPVGNGVVNYFAGGTVHITSPNVSWNEGTGNLVFTVNGFYKITIIGTIASGDGTWPGPFVQYGSQLPGFSILGQANSRYNTSTPSASPDNFTGIALTLSDTPDPQTGTFTDEYIVTITSNPEATTQKIGVYMAVPSASTTAWTGSVRLIVQFLG